MSEIVHSKNPRKSHFGENAYQYFKQRKDGWTFSVVCNHGTQGQEFGLFEVGIWDNSNPKHNVIIIDTHLNFSEVAKIEKQFDKDPIKLAEKYDVPTWSNPIP